MFLALEPSPGELGGGGQYLLAGGVRVWMTERFVDGGGVVGGEMQMTDGAMGFDEGPPGAVTDAAVGAAMLRWPGSVFGRVIAKLAASVVRSHGQFGRTTQCDQPPLV